MKKKLYWVLSVHLALLAILLGDHWVKREKKTKTPIHIRSIEIKPVEVAVKTPAKPVSTPKQVLKKVEKPKSVKPLPAKKAETKQEIKPLVKKEELPIPILPSASFQERPQTQEEEKIDSSVAVASYLKDLLILPEIGDVKVLVCINKQGYVESIEILESKSQKNQDFLKNRLSEISFPWLNEETKLTLVFRND